MQVFAAGDGYDRFLPVGSAGQVGRHGEVVGRFGTPSADRSPAIWHDGEVTLLGTFGGNFGDAVAISDAGFIAGHAADTARQPRAFRWDPMLGLVDIEVEDCCQSSSDALGVNNRGDVTGEAAVICP